LISSATPPVTNPAAANGHQGMPAGLERRPLTTSTPRYRNTAHAIVTARRRPRSTASNQIIIAPTMSTIAVVPKVSMRLSQPGPTIWFSRTVLP
jgi:hypothetical protein